MSCLEKLKDMDQQGYKKWRFNAEDKPSRSTLWQRKKRKLESRNSEDDLCVNEVSQLQPDGDSLILDQDEDARDTASKFNQLETSLGEERERA